MLLFHSLSGRAVNRSLAWVTAKRLAGSGSAAANYDDHAFVISIDARRAPEEAAIRAAFDPTGWRALLQHTVETTETLGRRFRHVAEIGQLLPKRTALGLLPHRTASWSGSLLYSTLLKYEPGHPLLREAVREVIEDQLDADRAHQVAAAIFRTPWTICDLPRPSPFAVPLFAFFHRETLLAQDVDRAIEEFASEIWEEWNQERQDSN